MQNHLRLDKLKVVITRPTHQAKGLAHLIAANGGISLLFPTLEICSIEPNFHLDSVLQNLNAYDLAIFTSQNAVHLVAPHWPTIKDIQIAAIGSSTAKALAGYQLAVDFTPMENYSSEALLSVLPPLQSKQIVIFTGENGRGWLQQRLTKQAAVVHVVPVYRRVLPNASRETIQEIVDTQNCIVVVTSGESLTNLLTLFQNAGFAAHLFTLPIIVISNRMMQIAIDLGFEKNFLVLATNPSDQAILDVLIKWYA